jgi:hypothetical protein
MHGFIIANFRHLADGLWEGRVSLNTRTMGSCVDSASDRPKCRWIQKKPRTTSLLMNQNRYHWVRIKHMPETEVREWEPGGHYATR